ncbi:hypothetical protein D3C75_1174880 [compost metagenome]
MRVFFHLIGDNQIAGIPPVHGQMNDCPALGGGCSSNAFSLHQPGISGEYRSVLHLNLNPVTGNFVIIRDNIHIDFLTVSGADRLGNRVAGVALRVSGCLQQLRFR